MASLRTVMRQVKACSFFNYYPKPYVSVGMNKFSSVPCKIHKNETSWRSYRMKNFGKDSTFDLSMPIVEQYNSSFDYKVFPASLFAVVFLANNLDGKNKNRFKRSLLQCAAMGDDYGVKRLLNEMKNHDPEVVNEIINCRHELGWTPLMAAAINGHTEILVALLKSGADPNITDEFTTARQISRKLRVHELEVRKQRENLFSDQLNPYSNFQGFTALHYAVISDSTSSIRVLLENGTDTLLRNHLGHRATEYVSENNDQLYEMLKSHEEMQERKRKDEEIQERLNFPLEQRLKEDIIGQEGPISLVSSCIRRKQNGWYDEEHPLVFLFLGSSGVGKTELAKQVANYLHKGDKKGFIRLDMSEYQEKHEVAKLIGAPPGYIGHDQGGQLTKKLRAKPDAIVLFDEVDKAHPDVLTVLLQLFDEGRLTDGQGKTIDCKNAIFVMTSNLASEEIAHYGARLRQEAATSRKNRVEDGADVPSLIRDRSGVVSRTFKENVVRPILKKHFGRDEFLGRINEFVYFLPFSDEELLQLVEKELNMWKEIALKKHKVHVNWQKPDIPTILADGYNIYYGARSIKYEVDRRVIGLLASAHERGLLKEGSNVHVKTPATSDELAQASNLSNAPIQLEITSSKSKNPLIVSEKDVWNWHHKESSTA